MKSTNRMMLMSKRYGESAEKSRMGSERRDGRPEGHDMMRREREGWNGHDGMRGRGIHDRAEREGMHTGREYDGYGEDDPHGRYGSRGEHDRHGGWQNREMIATGSAWINPGQSTGRAGGSHGYSYDPVDEPTAMRWVMAMEQPEGGRPMPAYKPEEAEALRKAHCPDCDKWEFFTAINMMYSDMYEVAKKFAVDKPEYYACMAKAFLKDKDAGQHKLRKHMEMIPKG